MAAAGLILVVTAETKSMNLSNSNIWQHYTSIMTPAVWGGCGSTLRMLTRRMSTCRMAAECANSQIAPNRRMATSQNGRLAEWANSQNFWFADSKNRHYARWRIMWVGRSAMVRILRVGIWRIDNRRVDILWLDRICSVPQITRI